MFPKNIAIVGLGLMGGSLAASCRKKYPKARITGISRTQAALRFALKKKWIHEASTDLAKGLRKADLIVLATPVNTFPVLLKKIDSVAMRGAIVTDVGSVKRNILKEIEKRSWKRISFISAHPMMGSHERGIFAASKTLYDKGFIFIIRPRHKNSKSLSRVKAFWKRINPRTFEVSAQDHDRIVGEISHFPHLVSIALTLAVNPKSIRFAGTGFRDVTRLARSSPEIWLPILQSNRPEILRMLGRLRKTLVRLGRATSHNQAGSLARLMREAIRRRSEI